MNKFNTEELTWKGALLVFKALCKNIKRGCSNCINCAHFEYIEGCKKNE